MKRLLLISHAFPPSLLPESLLVLRTVRALHRLGWHITVVTTSASDGYTDDSLMAQLPSEVEVIRVRGWDRVLNGRWPGARALRRLLLALGLPETNMAWLPAAIRSVRRLLAVRQFDVVHSWASPHTSNVAGAIIKRLTGLSWIAHMSDPWIDNPYASFSGLRRLAVKKLEQAVVAHADAIVFITEQASTSVMSKYGSAFRSKARIIPHGYDSIDVDPDVAGAESRATRLRLMHIGSFYSGKRTPENLLRAMNLLKKEERYGSAIELRLIGPNARDYRPFADSLGLGDAVSCEAAVPFTAAIHAMRECDVLVLIDASQAGASESVFLPSKLVDYLIPQKPILGITPSRGASADLITQLGCPIVDPDDVDGIAKSLRHLVDRWSAGDLSLSEASQRVVSQYDINATTRVLDNVLQSSAAAVVH